MKISQIPTILSIYWVLFLKLLHLKNSSEEIKLLKCNSNEEFIFKPQNTSVIVEGLDSSKVQGLYTAIHFDETKQKFFDRALYCKRLRTSSPLKTSNNSEASDVAASSSSIGQLSLARPQIPGLPEEERVKGLQKSKRQNEGKVKSKTVLMTTDYFKKPKQDKPLPCVEKTLSEFEFSDYDESEHEQFEDSKEILTDSESELSDNPSSAPSVSKRPLQSPENIVIQKNKKKFRTEQKTKQAGAELGQAPLQLC